MASYDQLLEQNGTIFNQGARVAYKDPNQLAADLGTTADKIQWGNIAKAGANFDPTGYFGYTAPNTKAPVPSADLNTSSVMPPAPATSNPSPFVGGITDSQKFFQDLYTKQAADFEAQQKERDDLKRILGEGYDKLNTYGDVYKQTESSFGIPKMYEDLNKLNLQVADLAGMYDKEFARVETKGIQSGTAGVFYQGEQAAIQRQKAVEIGALSVRQAAMVGNLDLMNQRLEKTVELQFKPIENKIQQTLQFLDLNYQDMNAAEKRQADTLQTALAFQQQALQQQKEDRSNALMAGVNTKFFKYPGSDLVYDTTTGEGVTYDQYIARGGKADFSNITEFNPMETQQVLEMASQYPDAGITPRDTLQSAQAKLRNSRIYQEKVRPPVSAGGGGGGSTGVLGLTNQQIDNISPLVTQFQNSPIVSNYNTIGEGYSFVKSLSNKTTNPADDQALIYSLAKALDPGSVVREGEYATVQKYAQSMVQSYGKSVTQALSGTGFLSEDARKNIKSTIESRFKSAETSYNNLYKETERRVNLIGNTNMGSQLLNNYGGAFAPQSTTPSGFVGPVVEAQPEEIVTTPETKGWWGKTTNWLWGDN